MLPAKTVKNGTALTLPLAAYTLGHFPSSMLCYAVAYRGGWERVDGVFLGIGMYGLAARTDELLAKLSPHTVSAVHLELRHSLMELQAVVQTLMEKSPEGGVLPDDPLLDRLAKYAGRCHQLVSDALRPMPHLSALARFGQELGAFLLALCRTCAGHDVDQQAAAERVVSAVSAIPLSLTVGLDAVEELSVMLRRPKSTQPPPYELLRLAVRWDGQVCARLVSVNEMHLLHIESLGPRHWQAVLNGVPYQISEEQSLILRSLLNARDNFLTAEQIRAEHRPMLDSVRIERRIAELPPALRMLIETVAGKGGGSRLVLHRLPTS